MSFWVLLLAILVLVLAHIAATAACRPKPSGGYLLGSFAHPKSSYIHESPLRSPESRSNSPHLQFALKVEATSPTFNLPTPVASDGARIHRLRAASLVWGRGRRLTDQPRP
jgi:hypothetical protein